MRIVEGVSFWALASIIVPSGIVKVAVAPTSTSASATALSTVSVHPLRLNPVERSPLADLNPLGQCATASEHHFADVDAPLPLCRVGAGRAKCLRIGFRFIVCSLFLGIFSIFLSLGIFRRCERCCPRGSDSDNTGTWNEVGTWTFRLQSNPLLLAHL